VNKEPRLERDNQERHPAAQLTDGSDLSRLSQADGAGRQKAHAVHQPCGSDLSLRDMRDQDETDGEGALTLSVQADLFGNPFEGVSIKRFQTA
jgi:hypothetical protein